MKFLSILLLVLGLSFAACEDDVDTHEGHDQSTSDVTEATPESDVVESTDDAVITEEVTEEVTETEDAAPTEGDVEEPEEEPEGTSEGDPTEFNKTDFRFSTPTPDDPGGDD